MNQRRLSKIALKERDISFYLATDENNLNTLLRAAHVKGRKNPEHLFEYSFTCSIHEKSFSSQEKWSLALRFRNTVTV